MRTLAVVADDFGLSASVDRGILEAFAGGGLTGTTVMLNFPEFESTCARLREAPGLDVGAHLNLTAGAPLSDPRDLSSLVDADGRFLRRNRLAAKLSLGLVRRAEVRREWSAQLERGRALGLRFSVLTSHEHVHMFPSLVGLVTELALEHEIPYVRCTLFPWRSVVQARSLRVSLLQGMGLIAAPVIAGRGASRNRCNVLLSAGEAQASLASLAGDLRRLPPGGHELICHPGYVDEALTQRDPYTHGRVSELRTLLDPGFTETIADAGIQPIKWSESVDPTRPSPRWEAVP